MKKSILLLGLVASMGVQTAFAQGKLAKGRVLDQNNEPIAGASIKVVGTNAGTMTDADGNFSFELPEGKTQLEISSLGVSKIVKAGESMNVVLNESETTLQELIVTTPYGPAKTKEQWTGAADVIGGKQIEKMPVSDFTKALEGAAPGLQISNGGGQPGSGVGSSSTTGIRIRGIGSISGNNNPLIVLDGTPYAGDLTSINPLDIATVTVLKDASAMSLYGARGSNGVILVTTKSGKGSRERPRITVDGKVGAVTRGLKPYDVMTDAKDYYETAWRAYYNQLVAGGASDDVARQIASEGTSAGQSIVDILGYNSYKIPGVDNELQNSMLLDRNGKLNPNAQLRYYDDWLKESQRTGLRQDYNFNVAGGSEKTDYYLSLGYLKEEGYVKHSNYDRLTARLNVNSQITDWLKVGMNLSGAVSTQNFFGATGANSGNPSFMSQTFAPIYPVYYRDSNDQKVIDPYTGNYKFDYGSLVADPEFSMGTRAVLPGNNILGEMELNEDRNKGYNVVVIPYLEAKFLKDFTFKTTLNANMLSQNVTSYNTQLHGQFKSQGGVLGKYIDNYFTYTWNQMLTYAKSFEDKHNLDVTAVHENYSYWNSYVNGQNNNFPSDVFRDLAVASGTPITTSRTYDDRIESYLLTGNYSFDDKYFLNANVRRDGSSRFSEDSRWGTFWGVGAGWILSKEKFMESTKDWLSFMKLKASYGTVGQQDPPGNMSRYYPWQGLYDLSRPNGNNSAAIQTSLPNPDLRWERQQAFNVGVEFGLFNDRLTAEVNYFDKATNDLYYNVPMPRSTGMASKVMNVGAMSNRGVELNLFATPVKIGSFAWTTNLTLTHYKNKITKLVPGIVDSFITGNFMYKPGTSIYEFYLVHSEGVDPTNGDELYSFDSAGAKIVTNDYNRANASGRKFVGSAIPDLTGGLTNTLSFKGLEFSFMFTFGIGGKYYDAQYQGLMTAGGYGNSNFHKDILNSWTPENSTSTIPRVEYASINIGQTSDRWLVDGSYLNLRNINLRYSIPSKTVKNLGLQSASAYVAVDNVFLMTKRQGMNPQASFDGQNSYPYIPSRTIMVGLTLGL